MFSHMTVKNIGIICERNFYALLVVWLNISKQQNDVVLEWVRLPENLIRALNDLSVDVMAGNGAVTFALITFY